MAGGLDDAGPVANRYAVSVPHLLCGELANADLFSEWLNTAETMDKRAKCAGFLDHRYATYHMPKTVSIHNVPRKLIWYPAMATPGDRLRELRMKKGYASALDAARAFGWNENTYKSHENGERGIRLDAARRYATAFGSDAGYILAGAEPAAIVQAVSSIPVKGLVAAGHFRPNDWEPQDSVQVPAIPRKGIPASSQYAVRVDGPSVNKRIADGLYAICALFDSFPGGAPPGSLVHVVRERAGEIEHTLKELRVTREGIVLMPVSNDPAYQEPIPYRSDDETEVRINGVVIGVFQPF